MATLDRWPLSRNIPCLLECDTAADRLSHSAQVDPPIATLAATSEPPQPDCEPKSEWKSVLTGPVLYPSVAPRSTKCTLRERHTRRKPGPQSHGSSPPPRSVVATREGPHDRRAADQGTRRLSFRQLAIQEAADHAAWNRWLAFRPLLHTKPNLRLDHRRFPPARARRRPRG